MQQHLARAESFRLAKAYIVEHDNDSLAVALADPSCPQVALLATLLRGCGFDSVAVDDTKLCVNFLAGPTSATATLQLTFEKNTRKLSGVVASLMNTAYSLLSAYEHELHSVVYLPPDMRRRRIQAVCNRLGVDDSFFQNVIRNYTEGR